MAESGTLALDLAELEVEPISLAGSGVVRLDRIDSGHGLTEVGASVCATSCCSCCLACCCCCW